MPDASTDDIRSWDAAADRYAEMVGPAGDSFWRRFEPFLTRTTPRTLSRVLDLGCGHGWLADVLARPGVEVVGVDGSRELVAQARARRPDVQFDVADLTAGLPASVGVGFDLVVSHMVLMDLPDLAPLLAGVMEALAPTGVLVASILHPAFFRQQPVLEPFRHRQVTGYLQHEEWWIESFGGHRHYHRPLAWYVQQLAAAGLVVTDLDEPRSLPHDGRPESSWSDDEHWFANLPTMLAFAARPAAST